MPMYFGSVLVCQVACASLALLVSSQSHQAADCAGLAQCPGERPLLPNGCCPRQAGEECQPDAGHFCDHELGFVCLNESGKALTNNATGVCKGRYDLRVISREQKTLTVQWTDFAPPNYGDNEYILMLRTDSHNYDVGNWDQREIGREPRYTIYNLQPSTLYLIKVAVWKNARTSTLGNISETIMVKTKDVDFCDVEEFGGRFKVGETFQVEGEDECTCQPSGELDCVPLCDEMGLPDVRPHCQVKYEEGSCDYSIICPVAGESCNVNNVTHPHGTEIADGCKTCACDNGKLECSYPHHCDTEKPSEDCLRPILLDVEGKCCPEWQCDDVCVYENTTYEDGEFFTSSQCGLCQCNVSEGVQCATQCPPVETVLPDAACPDPHIRKTGCCDTLHCFDPDMDDLSFMQNVFALSISPVTLTVSFVVETESEELDVPIYCHYEIFYANTTTNPVRWQNEIVQPIDVRTLSDSSSMLEPREALAQESAIVVDMRAYVTLAGMRPNTTYYVKVQKMEKEKQHTASDDKNNKNVTLNGQSAMVVVKTMPLKNITSCFHAGREVPHGQLTHSNCSQTCHCLHGDIHCKSSCPDQEVVILSSPSCPNPRLEKEDGECCSQWKCYPTESGCQHKNTILQPGQTVNDGCSECRCLDSALKCFSLCPLNGVPSRHGCVLRNVTGLCCPQWSCPHEEQPPIGVKRSIFMNFMGTCPTPVNSFKNDLISHFNDYITRLVDCSADLSDISYNLCHKLKLQVKCNDESSQNMLRQRRSSAVIKVVITMERNLSSTRDMSMVSEVDLTILKLQELLNTTVYLNLTDGTVLKSTHNIHLQSQEYICNPGFSYVNGHCEIEFNNFPKILVDLSIIKATSKSALMQWRPIGQSLQPYLENLVIKFKANGSRVWSSTETFQSWITSWVLLELHPNTVYTAKLISMSSSKTSKKWTLANITFQTLPYSGVIPESLVVSEMYMSETSIILVWDPLPSEMLDGVKSIKVNYGTSNSNKMHKEIDVRGGPLAKLTDLSPGSQYTVTVEVTMLSGEIIESQQLDLVTQKFITEQRSDRDLLIPLVITCVVAAAAISLCVLLYWRKNSQKDANRGFENKTYGIQMENSSDTTPNVNPS